MRKRVFGRNHLYENMFRLQAHFHANQTHIYMTCCARGLVLKQEAQGNSISVIHCLTNENEAIVYSANQMLFSSLKATLLVVSTENRDRVPFYEHAQRIRFVLSANQIYQTLSMLEVRGWRTSGVGPGSRFLVLTKRSAGDENDQMQNTIAIWLKPSY